MSTTDVVRAWKNEDYVMSLNPAELAKLPANPAGEIELKGITGGRDNFFTTLKPCFSGPVGECTGNCK